MRWVLAFLLGVAWNLSGTAGALLSPVLFAIIAGRPARQRYLLAATYMLPAVASIVPSYQTFFSSIAGGAAVAVFAALVLATPYIFVKDGKTAVLAAGITSISILSPLSAAGWFFPNTGVVGVAMMIALIFSFAQRDLMFVLCALAAALCANAAFVDRTAPPAGWVGVGTAGIQPAGGDFMREISNIEALPMKPGAVLVYPEAVLDDAEPGTLAAVRDRIPRGQTWLLGAEANRHDSVWLFAAKKQPADVFDSAMPMPGTMVNPLDQHGYLPAWFEPAKTVAGRRVWAGICFEQVLPAAWIEALAQRPDTLLLVSNDWWAKQGNPAPAIRDAQARAWVRLLNVPTVMSTNRAIHE